MLLQSSDPKGFLLRYCLPSGTFLCAKPLAMEMKSCQTGFRRVGIQHVWNPTQGKNYSKKTRLGQAMVSSAGFH